MRIKDTVLVLNSDYQAITICSIDRAFILVYQNKADMVTARDDRKLRSKNETFECPSIIRLKHYVQLPYRKIHLSRYNVFRRDGHMCVYCGSKKDLTIDHVVPKSAGGRDTWENLVTSCQPCNAKKGSLSLSEAGLTLDDKPFRPSFVMYMSKFTRLRKDWKPYLYMS